MNWVAFWNGFLMGIYTWVLILLIIRMIKEMKKVRGMLDE